MLGPQRSKDVRVLIPYADLSSASPPFALDDFTANPHPPSRPPLLQYLGRFLNLSARSVHPITSIPCSPATPTHISYHAFPNRPNQTVVSSLLQLWRHVEWLNSHELPSWSTAMFRCCPTGRLFVASIGRLCMRPVLLAAVRSSNPSRLPGEAYKMSAYFLVRSTPSKHDRKWQMSLA